MLKDLFEGKPLRHPIHPMLVHFPIGFFVLSFILDLVSLTPTPRPFLVPAAFYAMLLGVITALLAAIPGFVDYTDIRRDHPAKGTATTHLSLNLIAVVLYAINLWIRAPGLSDARVSWVPLILSFIGVSLLSASGYLGGRLVYDEGIAVGRHKRDTATPKETLHPSTSHVEKEGDMNFVLVPDAERLRNGETLRVQIEKQVMTITRIDGLFYAFQEFCTHRFGPLSEGSFHGFSVQCPWHNSCFDIRTGKVSNGPAKVDLKTFRVEQRDGKIYVGVAAG
jgi:uncharacterized membrane protein/nitrite reductase/ring-hydroxylating ferredoxin subunit